MKLAIQNVFRSLLACLLVPAFFMFLLRDPLRRAVRPACSAAPVFHLCGHWTHRYTAKENLQTYTTTSKHYRHPYFSSPPSSTSAKNPTQLEGRPKLNSVRPSGRPAPPGEATSRSLPCHDGHDGTEIQLSTPYSSGPPSV